jgi:CheY-like chemotaxis protein
MARILIMDDEAIVLGFLQSIFERLGHDVAVVMDGLEGLRLFREEPADLVIVDLMLPGRAGLLVIEEIHLHFPDASIVALSGSLNPKPLEKAKALGARLAFQKPFDLDAFLLKVAEALAG